MLQLYPVNPAGADKVTLPPLQKIVGPPAVITGLAGSIFTITEAGAEVFVQPAALVTATVYKPLVCAMIEEVLSLVLHNKLPLAVVDKVELPQLFIILIVGVNGTAFGVAIAEPCALVQPPIVCITVYVPALVTVIDEVAAPLLHNKVPVAVVDKVDEPQLFEIVITGTGTASGCVIVTGTDAVHPLASFIVMV